MFDTNDDMEQRQHVAAWIIGGFLVGFGTRMGNGCTSGHGVCGLPRIAPRSIAATMSFMATGFGLATLRYHVPFLTGGTELYGQNYTPVWRWVALGILCLGNIYSLILGLRARGRRLDLAISYFLGLIFGFGLLVSGMCRLSKIQGFLSIGKAWDPSLAFVMFSAVAINLVSFNLTLTKREKPYISGEKFGVPPRGVVDLKLVAGSAIFGLGWSLGGLCPGPGIIVFFGMTHGLLWMVAFIFGQLFYDRLQAYVDARKSKKDVAMSPQVHCGPEADGKESTGQLFKLQQLEDVDTASSGGQDAATPALEIVEAV